MTPVLTNGSGGYFAVTSFYKDGRAKTKINISEWVQQRDAQHKAELELAVIEARIEELSKLDYDTQPWTYMDADQGTDEEGYGRFVSERIAELTAQKESLTKGSK